MHGIFLSRSLLTSQSLRAAIGPLQFSLRHWNLKNLTLQTRLSITPDFFRQHTTGWFPYDRRRSRIADRRSQKVLRSSAIIWKHTSAIEPCSIFCDRLRSSAIVCDRMRSCDHMETKVLRSAIEMYPIIFLILTDDSMFLSHKARMFDYSNAHLL